MFQKFYKKYSEVLQSLEDVSLLIIRVTLAYNFYMPAINKLGNLGSTAAFFESVGIWFPGLSAVLAGVTELLAVIFLPLGLGVRILGVPLIFVMFVAVVTLHWENGWAAGDNGMEIPVYYALFFLVLMSRGAGKWSLDRLLLEKQNR